MGILNFFSKKTPVLKCSVCENESTLSQEDFQFLLKANTLPEICPIIDQCQECFGFAIPIQWRFKGKNYLFDEVYQKLGPLIENNDPRIQHLAIIFAQFAHPEQD